MAESKTTEIFAYRTYHDPICYGRPWTTTGELTLSERKLEEKELDQGRSRLELAGSFKMETFNGI